MAGMIAIPVELKHLPGAAIVADAAISGRVAGDATLPPHSGNHIQDVRPSTGHPAAACAPWNPSLEP